MTEDNLHLRARFRIQVTPSIQYELGLDWLRELQQCPPYNYNMPGRFFRRNLSTDIHEKDRELLDPAVKIINLINLALK